MGKGGGFTPGEKKGGKTVEKSNSYLGEPSRIAIGTKKLARTETERRGGNQNRGGNGQRGILGE